MWRHLQEGQFRSQAMNNVLLVGLSFLVMPSHASSGSVSGNIMSAMAGSSDFLISLFYITGLAMMFSGIAHLKKLGNRTAFMNADSGIIGPVSRLAIGAALIFLPSFLEVMNRSIWGHHLLSSADELAYSSSTSAVFSEAIRPIIMIIQFIGMVAMLRGFLILSKATGQGAQPGTISKGFVHIFGGLMAVNIVKTVNIVVGTFGLN